MGDTAVAASPSGVPRPPRRWRAAAQTQLSQPLPVLSLTLVVAVIMVTAAFPALVPLHRAALWSLVLLVSFAGWGSLVARLVFPRHRPDLGLRLAWGMAALVSLGGVACVVSLANRLGLLALVVVGIGLELAQLAGRLGGAAAAPAPAPPRPTATAIALALVALLAAVQLYGGAAAMKLQPDDFQSYLIFPQKILATGTLLDAFSVRRVAAYGGQSLLHALTLLGSPNPLTLPVVDIGISLIIVIALIIAGRSRAPLGLWLLPVLFILTLPNIRANSTSLMSGVVVFLALFRTASSDAFAENPRRGGAVLGLLAAAAASLRQPFIIPAAAFLVIFYTPLLVGALWRRGPESARILRGIAVAAVSAIGFLSPWALLSYMSSGTPLFPLFDGYYHPEYGRLTGTDQNLDRAGFLWTNLWHCHPVRTLPLFLLAALLIPWRRTRGALPALTLAALLGLVAIAWGFPLSDEYSIARYYFGFVTAAVIAVSMYVCALPWRDWEREPVRTAIPTSLALVALLLQVGAGSAESYRDYEAYAARIWISARSGALLDENNEDYRLLQARVPAGAPMVVMLDRPFSLDYDRNPIDVLDLPGNVSPPPGLPLDSDDALADYLTAHGYRYLSFVRSTESQGVYLRSGWERMLGPPPSALWGNAVPLYLKTFDRFESLMKSRVRLYDDGQMVVLDLTRRIG